MLSVALAGCGFSAALVVDGLMPAAQADQLRLRRQRHQDEKFGGRENSCTRNNQVFGAVVVLVAEATNLELANVAPPLHQKASQQSVRWVPNDHPVNRSVVIKIESGR